MFSVEVRNGAKVWHLSATSQQHGEELARSFRRSGFRATVRQFIQKGKKSTAECHADPEGFCTEHWPGDADCARTKHWPIPTTEELTWLAKVEALERELD